jgi:hypothetical protein
MEEQNRTNRTEKGPRKTYFPCSGHKDGFCMRRLDRHLKSKWHQKASSYVVRQTPSCALAKLLAIYKGQMLLQRRKEEETIRS